MQPGRSSWGEYPLLHQANHIGVHPLCGEKGIGVRWQLPDRHRLLEQRLHLRQAGRAVGVIFGDRRRQFVGEFAFVEDQWCPVKNRTNSAG